MRRDYIQENGMKKEAKNPWGLIPCDTCGEIPDELIWTDYGECLVGCLNDACPDERDTGFRANSTEAIKAWNNKDIA